MEKKEKRKNIQQSSLPCHDKNLENRNRGEILQLDKEHLLKSL